MSNKKENTRIVDFKENYKVKSGKVIYKKGSQHAIHKDTVAKIKSHGAKMDVRTYKEFKSSKKSKKQ